MTQIAGTANATYKYDYRTRRVYEYGAFSLEHLSIFDGGTSISEYDSDNDPTTPFAQYVRGVNQGGGVGGLEYCVRPIEDNKFRYNSYNARGDVTGQTDSTAATTWLADYAGFGDVDSSSGT